MCKEEASAFRKVNVQTEDQDAIQQTGEDAQMSRKSQPFCCIVSRQWTLCLMPLERL